MKDQLMCSNRYWLISILVMASCILQAQSDLNSRLEFKDEFSVDVNQPPYTIRKSRIQKYKKRFQNQVRCANDKQCTSDALSVKASQMVNKLYTLSSKLINDPKSGCTGNKCLSGVWIYIAMEHGQPTYFFQPAVLRFKEWAKKEKAAFEDITNVKELFIYSNNVFELSDNAILNKRIEEYKGNIKIKHYRYRGKPEEVNLVDNTWRGDTRKLFYSFQEILGFYALHNPVDKNNVNDFYKHNIYIHPSVGLFRGGITNSWRVKHNTFITVDTNNIDAENKETKKLNKKVAAINPSADGTDLAHVCPSNCDDTLLIYPATATQMEQERINKR